MNKYNTAEFARIFPSPINYQILVGVYKGRTMFSADDLLTLMMYIKEDSALEKYCPNRMDLEVSYWEESEDPSDDHIGDMPDFEPSINYCHEVCTMIPLADAVALVQNAEEVDEYYKDIHTEWLYELMDEAAQARIEEAAGLPNLGEIQDCLKEFESCMGQLYHIHRAAKAAAREAGGSLDRLGLAVSRATNSWKYVI